MGRFQRALLLPFLVLTILAVACQQTAAPAPLSGQAKPAEPAKPAEAKPAAPVKPADAAKPAEAAKPADALASAPAGKPQTGGTLRVALSGDLLTLDPHLSSSSFDRQLYQSVFDTLVRLDKDLNITPGLAKSWEQPDPKTIVFKLQPGVKYHDGEPFNAASVKANVDRMKNHPKSLRKGEIDDIVSVDVVDDLTVKFNLKGPSSPFLSLITDRAGMMVSTKAADAAGDDFARNPVGTGPFKFVEWKKDDHLTVRKFDQYWEKDADGVQLPYLDEVVYRPVPDGTQRLNALKTSTVDIIDAPAAKDIPALKAAPELTLSEVPGLAYRYIRFNTAKPPVDNKALRQAMAWSIDREAINKAIFFGFGQPAYQGIPPSSFAFDPDFHANAPRDVNKAKAILAAAGLQNPVVTTHIINSPEDKQLAEAIKEQMAEAGITLNLELLEAAVVTDRGLKGEFEAGISSWSGRPDPDGNVFDQFSTKGRQNQTRYANAEVDRLLEAARASYDQAERKKLYGEANVLITDDTPMVFIQHRPEVKVMLPTVQGFSHVPDGMMRFGRVSLKQ